MRTAYLIGVRFHPYRFVTDNFAAVEHRRDIRIDPIMVAVACAILDDAHPGLALLERAPHMGKDSGGHIGVTNDVLGRTYQV
ncbi:hypothetical protein D3C73_935460 [compost metagenome]